MLSAKPVAKTPVPEGRFRAWCFKVVTSARFEAAVMITIILNTIVFMTKHYGEPEWWGPGPDGLGVNNVSFVLNAVFCFLFVIEAAIKLLGLGKYYFKSGWN